jgi:hypothetical protein
VDKRKKWHDNWWFKAMMTIIAGLSVTAIISLWGDISNATRYIKSVPQLQKNDSIQCLKQATFESGFEHFLYRLDRRLYMDSVTNSQAHDEIKRGQYRIFHKLGIVDHNETSTN